jgi:4-amino-4-deoxy-L-arabinose transferase-like glycosyltransferase
MSSALFFNRYQQDYSPPGFNADEAAFGYNAYSISQTGKDEYGKFLPLRLKSFGDYKLPLLTYLSVPIIKIFGLSQTTTRLPNTLLAVLFPLLIFLLTQELFSQTPISLLASFFTATSLGLNIVGRHTHEAYLASFLTAWLLLTFLKLIKKTTLKAQINFFLILILALFAYHPNRIFAGVFFLLTSIYVFKKKLPLSFLFIFSLILSGFLITDIIYTPARVNNLLFFKDPGFLMRINELKGEGHAFFYNKLTVAIKELIDDYLTYFSPQFLVINSLNNNINYRFGFPGMGYLNLVEYLGVLLGGYYLFKKQEKKRWLLLIFLLTAPLAAILAWQKSSLTRSFFIFIPLLIIAAYGLINLGKDLKKSSFSSALIIMFLIGLYLFFFVYNWTFYFFHYPQRALVINAWQAGYQHLAEYIKKNYSRYDHFYITKDNGMPYIFLLFYLQYPPEKYQQQAHLSTPDQYGFGQVEGFDKFIFHFVNQPSRLKNSVLIGSPADFAGITENIDHNKIITIKKANQVVFMIYPTN